MSAKEWSTQTELGRMFAMNPRQMGLQLAGAGLKLGPAASVEALRAGFARPVRDGDGSVSFLWRTNAVVPLLRERGLRQVPLGRPPKETRRPATISYRSYDKIVATHGCASDAGAHGGWAWVDQSTGDRGAGALKRATAEQMSMVALLQALRHAGARIDLLVRTQDAHLVDVSTRLGARLRANGWKLRNGEPPKNLALLTEVVAEVGARVGRTDFQLVKPGAADEHNEAAELLAVGAGQAAARSAARTVEQPILVAVAA